MKHLFSIFSMLVLVVLSVGCSDNETEESVRRIYPTEEQSWIETEQLSGYLKYDKSLKKQVITPYNFQQGGDEVDIVFIVEKIPEEYCNMEGEVRFQGDLLYLYRDEYPPFNGVGGRTLYYSIKIQKMSEDNKASRSTIIGEICGTISTNQNPYWITSSRALNTDLYVMNVFLHVVRSSSGLGLNKDSVSETIINKLNNYYYNGNIQFHLIGSDYIDSDRFYNFESSLFDELISINRNNHAINIYVLSKADVWGNVAGKAEDIPALTYVVKGEYYNRPTIAHEMGHCLGLFHTHRGTAINDFAEGGVPEYVNGSNSLTAGDKIEDTPADPCEWNVWGEYCGTGTDLNGDFYNPSPINLMSYNSDYRTSFTSDQFEAMRNCISTHNDLANAIHTRVIEGNNHFCSSAAYNISFLNNNETVNWTVTKYYPSSTADDQPLSSQTTTYSGSSITLNASNQSAYYVIQATINGTSTVAKTVTSYAPSPYIGTLAWETTDGQFGVTTNMEHGNTLYVSGNKTLSFEYLDQGGNTEANFICITAANRYLNGSTITLQPADCTTDLKIRTANSCGTSGNFFTIPCEVTSYSYNLNLNSSTLSIDVEETAKASLASALSIRESDIKSSGDIQSIIVHHVDGQVIFTKNYSVATKSIRIDTSSWPTGEYILSITNGDMTQKRKVRIK